MTIRQVHVFGPTKTGLHQVQIIYWETRPSKIWIWVKNPSRNAFPRDFYKLQKGVVHFSPFKTPAHFKNELLPLNSFFIFKLRAQVQCSIFAHRATSSERSPRLSCAGGVSRNIFGGKKGVGVPDSHSSIDSFFFNKNISFLISEKVQGGSTIYQYLPLCPDLTHDSLARMVMRIPVTIYLQGENFDTSYDRIVAIDAATSCGTAGAYNVKGTMCLGEDFLDIEIEVIFFLNLTMVSSGVTRF